MAQPFGFNKQVSDCVVTSCRHPSQDDGEMHPHVTVGVCEHVHKGIRATISICDLLIHAAVGHEWLGRLTGSKLLVITSLRLTVLVLGSLVVALLWVDPPTLSNIDLVCRISIVVWKQNFLPWILSLRNYTVWLVWLLLDRVKVSMAHPASTYGWCLWELLLAHDRSGWDGVLWPTHHGSSHVDWRRAAV